MARAFPSEDFLKSLDTWAVDPLHIVLKGHLLIERELVLYLDQRIPNPGFVQHARLRWPQLVALVRAYASADRNPWLWDALLRLNELRNSFAHELTAANRAVRIRAFLEAAYPYSHLRFREAPPDELPPRVETDDANNQLRYAIYAVAEAVLDLPAGN